MAELPQGTGPMEVTPELWTCLLNSRHYVKYFTQVLLSPHNKPVREVFRTLQMSQLRLRKDQTLTSKIFFEHLLCAECCRYNCRQSRQAPVPHPRSLHSIGKVTCPR